MRIDGVLVAAVPVSPYAIEELAAREHLAGVASEKVQQVELARREIHTLAAELRLALEREDCEVVYANHARNGCAPERVDAP